MRCSVIVPSLNQARFIGECLASLIEQSGVDLEVIVFDGGSDDDTVSILKSFGNRISWTSETDGGQANAINKGVRASTGEIVGYLNSDDRLLPDTLQKVIKLFEAPEAPDIVHGNAEYINECSDFIGRYRTLPWTPANLGAQCSVCQPATFWRRSLINQIGEMNERLVCSMDYDFWIRATLAGAKVSESSEVLASSRDYASTKTRALRGTIYREIIGMQKRHFGRAHAQWFYEFLCYLKWEERVKYRAALPSRLNSLLSVARLLSRFSGFQKPECSSFFDHPPAKFEDRTT